MPYYTTPLLSLYPNTAAYDHNPSPSHHIPTPIDPTILATVKTIDFVGYAPYPAALRATTRRNQVVGKNGLQGKKGEEPLFRSEKERQETRRRRDRIVSVRFRLDFRVRH